MDALKNLDRKSIAAFTLALVVIFFVVPRVAGTFAPGVVVVILMAVLAVALWQLLMLVTGSKLAYSAVRWGCYGLFAVAGYWALWTGSSEFDLVRLFIVAIEAFVLAVLAEWIVPMVVTRMAKTA